MNMNYSFQKTCLGIITLGVSCIAIELIPIARQASYWNQCLDNTIAWVNEANDLKEWSSVAKDSLAVGVCNGAVYQSELKTVKSK